MNTFIILVLVLNKLVIVLTVKRKVRKNNNNDWFSNELRMVKSFN